MVPGIQLVGFSGAEQANRGFGPSSDSAQGDPPQTDRAGNAYCLSILPRKTVPRGGGINKEAESQKRSSLIGQSLAFFFFHSPSPSLETLILQDSLNLITRKVSLPRTGNDSAQHTPGRGCRVGMDRPESPLPFDLILDLPPSLD